MAYCALSFANYTLKTWKPLYLIDINLMINLNKITVHVSFLIHDYFARVRFCFVLFRINCFDLDH